MERSTGGTRSFVSYHPNIRRLQLRANVGRSIFDEVWHVWFQIKFAGFEHTVVLGTNFLILHTESTQEGATGWRRTNYPQLKRSHAHRCRHWKNEERPKAFKKKNSVELRCPPHLLRTKRQRHFMKNQRHRLSRSFTKPAFQISARALRHSLLRETQQVDKECGRCTST